MTQKRSIIPIISFITIFLLMSCVVIPNEAQIIETEQEKLTASSCFDENGKFQSHFSKVRGGDQELDPGLIGLTSWNIKKGRSKNWPDDFHRFSSRSDILTLQEGSLKSTTTELLRSNGFIGA